MKTTKGTTQMTTATATTTKKLSATALAISIMNEMKDAPMSKVVERLFTNCKVNGKSFTAGQARTAYIYLVKHGRAPGTIEAKAPKAVVAVSTAKVKKKVDSNTDHVERLKRAAKRAGIHLDTAKSDVTENSNDDPLSMRAPEKLSMSDLKSLI